MKWTLARVFPFSIFILGSMLTAASLFSGGAPAFRTGAPGDLTCADSGCHVSNALNSGDGAVVIEGPATYLSGAPVEMSLRATRAGATRFGFEITARGADGLMAGSWDVVEGTQLAEFGFAPDYLTHATFAPYATDEYAWTIRWNPPSENAGDVTFYAAANTANGDNTQFNDYIYTTSLSVAYAGNTATERGDFPTQLRLLSTYPNPAMSQFTVEFELFLPSLVTVYVYDGLGRARIQTESGVLQSGAQELTVPVSKLSPGVYSYRVESGGHSSMGTIIVTR